MSPRIAPLAFTALNKNVPLQLISTAVRKHLNMESATQQGMVFVVFLGCTASPCSHGSWISRHHEFGPVPQHRRRHSRAVHGA